jgi:hypothetical protein
MPASTSVEAGVSVSDPRLRQHSQQRACGGARREVAGERRDELPLRLSRAEADVPHPGREPADHPWDQGDTQPLLDESEEKSTSFTTIEGTCSMPAAARMRSAMTRIVQSRWQSTNRSSRRSATATRRRLANRWDVAQTEAARRQLDNREAVYRGRDHGLGRLSACADRTNSTEPGGLADQGGSTTASAPSTRPRSAGSRPPRRTPRYRRNSRDRRPASRLRAARPSRAPSHPR